ncbi:unnamed protein product [Spirodela intermedia]|uniref:Uncharacterized protein n=1 Tax=Spirodela intermedia TaxID=51605 RepID=A0A7I8JAT4_SPIIN|nr:unnamed protein product [Spirodela intermedia]CAA6667277.1 unnamed protein product [Spirodela intermedia]
MRALPWAWRRCMRLTQLAPCPNVPRLRATHAVFVAHGLHRHTYALSRLVLLATGSAEDDGAADGSGGDFLSYAGLLLRHAEAPPNAFIFNTLIRAYARSPHPTAALFFFQLMRQRHHHLLALSGEEEQAAAVAPDYLTFPFVLHGCSAAQCPSPGLQLHGLLCKNGLAAGDHYVQTALLRLYVTFMELVPGGAHNLFDEIPRRDVVHWDVLMNGYLRRGLPCEALQLFRRLLLSGAQPDEVALTTALAACARAGALREGRWIHCYLRDNAGELRTDDAHICAALVTMYAKCGSLDAAREVFEMAPHRCRFLWSALIGGLAVHGLAEEAVGCLRRMQEQDGLRPDGVALLGALSACAHAGKAEEGRRLLAEMEALYGVGRLEEAVELARAMPMRPLASVWGSVLAGCRAGGAVELAELAVAELEKIEEELGAGAADGAHVQLWSIYMGANRAGRKTTGRSEIELDGVVSSFVSGDGEHPLRERIYETVHHLLAGRGGLLAVEDEELCPEEGPGYLFDDMSSRSR